MKNKTVGFIGGGRVARIILGGLKKAGQMPGNIAVSDTNPDVLVKLQSEYPEIGITSDIHEAAGEDLVFLCLHPPVLADTLTAIKNSLKPTAVLVSLAPKFSTGKISQLLGSFNQIVRMIPNAPSIIGKGYNPVAFSESFNPTHKESLKAYLGLLGKCPEVAEELLEAYAIVTAMGPTYLWFQFEELNRLALSFGMSRSEAESGIVEMVRGTLDTFFASGMTSAEVIDLVPVKPFGDEESTIRETYRSKLEPLYRKLRNG